jgi:hypothetical protein
MIVYLPVKVYDKCTNIPFNVDINNDTIIINTLNDIKIHTIILCSSLYGINYILVSFPLTFMLIKNELICDMFYIFQTLSSSNDIDFIHLFINSINNTKKNHSYTLYNNMNLPNLINILKLNNNNDNTIIDDNINTIINKAYYRINKYLNFCLRLMSDQTINNIGHSSKILQIINLIKQLKLNFFGNTLTIEEHIEHILNPKLIKKKRYYFYEKNNKIIKIFIDVNNINNLSKDNIFVYPSKYKDNINIKTLLNILIINNYDKLFELSCKVLYKKKPNIINLMININNKDVYIESTLLNKDELIKIIANDSSFTKFKEIISNDNNLNIVKELMNNYSYPINFDRRTLNENFAKILYYCINFNIQDININHKIKSIILFIIKFNKSLQEGDINIIYNSRIYSDIILFQIIKIILFNDTFKLLNINNIKNVKNKFINNLIIIHILNNLSWKTVSKQLPIYKYLINNKDICKDLILCDGKLNKQFTLNMDNRLKKIIIEPLYMFNYLKKEEDFYKWIINFKENIIKIFNNMINLENNDYKKLCRILYLYSKIKTQHIDDIYYKKLLGYLKINSRIVLFNDRINIKFKDIFKNININLGFMARDIINEEIISVTLSDDTMITESLDANKINETITKLKRKYYKYKGKYLEMKTNDSIIL